MKHFLPFLLFTFLFVGQTPGSAESYTLSIQSGFTLIANQLDQGGNTLNEVMPTVPNGCLLHKWNAATRAFYEAAAYNNGTWTPWNVTLGPGEGALLESPQAFLLTFTGTRRVPILPIPEAYQEGVYLLSHQIPEPGTFEDITGVTPCGTVVLTRWVGGSQVAELYDAEVGGWPTGSSPVMSVGEAFFISKLEPCPDPLFRLLVSQPAKSVSCGTDWSFDLPSPVDPCPGADPSITVLATVTNGTCPMVITRTWEGLDACAKRATCRQSVRVTDTIPPVIAGCSNMIVAADPGQAGAVVHFAPTASDSCGGPVTVVTVPLSGETFDVGSRTVRVLATDACGNSNTCEFTVTVTAQAHEGDLFLADTPYNYSGAPDFGNEPEPNMTGQSMWLSRAIWVQPDYAQPAGTYQNHQNPRYGQTNGVWVNVQNRGDGLVPDAVLEVYVANASLGLSWPAQWTLIGTNSLPAIPPGESHPAQVRWVPKGTGHYCLLARIVSTNDPMAAPELASISANVRANNNLAWRNVNVVNLLLTTGSSTEVRFKPVRRQRPRVELKGNGEPPSRQPVTVVCRTEEVFHQGAGEATLNLGAWFKRWQDAGGRGKGITVVGETTVRMTNTVAAIEDIPMDEDEEAIVNLTVKAPHPVPVAGTEHTCHIELTEEIEGEAVGGVNYGVKVRALHTDTDHDGIVDVDDPDDDGDGVSDVEDADPLGEPDCPPSALSIRYVDGKAVLSWNGLGYRLEATSVFGRAWRPIHGATSPFLVAPEDERSFFRLTCH